MDYELTRKAFIKVYEEEDFKSNIDELIIIRNESKLNMPLYDISYLWGMYSEYQLAQWLIPSKVTIEGFVNWIKEEIK